MIRAVVLSLVVAVAGAGVLAAAQEETVRITVTRANVRVGPAEDAQVLTQVTSGTALRLKAVSGDWYRIELPPDPRMGGARVEGWVSVKVAERNAPAAAAAATPTAGATATAKPTATAGPAAATSSGTVPVLAHGMSVAVISDAVQTWLEPETAAIRVIDADADSLRRLLTVFPAGDSPATAQGAVPATFVWTLPGRTSSRVVDGRRPALIVSLAGVAGVPPAELAPALVRLAPTLSGVRLIASVRARADQASQTSTDWNLTRDLRQDPIRTAVQPGNDGTLRLQPTGDLDPGEYAVVIRLRRNVSGQSALSADGDGRFLATVWSFSIR